MFHNCAINQINANIHIEFISCVQLKCHVRVFNILLTKVSNEEE